MNSPGRNEYQFFYDWQAACNEARRDGWNAEPIDAPNRVERAVQADFDFLSGYLNNEWGYVVVSVDMIDPDTGETSDSDELGGVETYHDYHVEQAYEMAGWMAEVATKAEQIEAEKQAEQARLRELCECYAGD